MDRQRIAEIVSEAVLMNAGQSLSDEKIDAIAKYIFNNLEGTISREDIPKKGEENRVVISSIGRDQPGVVASISNILSKNKVNILEINQTLVGGNFAMLMVVDISGCPAGFEGLKKELKGEAEHSGYKIFVQFERLLSAVQRI